MKDSTKQWQEVLDFYALPPATGLTPEQSHTAYLQFMCTLLTDMYQMCPLPEIQKVRELYTRYGATPVATWKRAGDALQKAQPGSTPVAYAAIELTASAAYLATGTAAGHFRFSLAAAELRAKPYRTQLCACIGEAGNPGYYLQQVPGSKLADIQRPPSIPIEL